MDISSGSIFIFSDAGREQALCVGGRLCAQAVDTLVLRPTLVFQPAVDAVHILARPAAGIVAPTLTTKDGKPMTEYSVSSFDRFGFAERSPVGICA
jgi:hypothetical protein